MLAPPPRHPHDSSILEPPCSLGICDSGVYLSIDAHFVRRTCIGAESKPHFSEMKENQKASHNEKAEVPQRIYTSMNKGDLDIHTSGRPEEVVLMPVRGRCKGNDDT